jgi:hypothetical protein
MKTGGLTNYKNTDEEVNKLLLLIKDQVEKELKTKIEDIEIIGYKTQVVAGVIFYIKVKNVNEYFHLKIFRSTDNNVKLLHFVSGKKEGDDLNYF